MVEVTRGLLVCMWISGWRLFGFALGLGFAIEDNGGKAEGVVVVDEGAGDGGFTHATAARGDNDHAVLEGFTVRCEDWHEVIAVPVELLLDMAMDGLDAGHDRDVAKVAEALFGFLIDTTFAHSLLVAIPQAEGREVREVLRFEAGLDIVAALFEFDLEVIERALDRLEEVEVITFDLVKDYSAAIDEGPDGGDPILEVNHGAALHLDGIKQGRQDAEFHEGFAEILEPRLDDVAGGCAEVKNDGLRLFSFEGDFLKSLVEVALLDVEGHDSVEIEDG